MALEITDVIAFLGLSRLRGVGFHSLRELGDIHGLASRLAADVGVDVLAKLLGHEHGSHERRLAHIEALGSDAYAVLSNKAIEMVAVGDERYPKSLYDLGERNRPNWFFYRGDVGLLDQQSVAVVGTRSPDEVGEFLTRYSVSTVKDVGASVVSGLARGVDEIAHEWALRSDVKNISVLGAGLLKVYPAKNASLADRIVNSGGVLISEYPPDADPTKESFVWRNRLQAALGSCVIAPQWKSSSGTAHTIRFAKQLRRRTINLTPSGQHLGPDHGVADETFSVPSEHERFERAVRQALTGTVLSAEKQLNLFGLLG